MENLKILGLVMVLAIICLSIGNAVTGHGIKGNNNLNVVVLAKESGGTESDEKKYHQIEGEPYNVDDKTVIDMQNLEICYYYDGIAIDYSCVSGTTLKMCFTYTSTVWDIVICRKYVD